MKLFKKVTTIAVVGMLAFSFVGCGKEKAKEDLADADKAFSLYPKEIEKLMEKEYKESISAVGMSNHSVATTAIKKAKLQADVELARQFEQEIAAIQKNFLEAINEEQIEDYRETIEGFTLIKLQGAKTVKEMVAETKDGYTGYVLKIIDLETLKEIIDQKTNALTEFKALAAYKDLDNRVAAEKAARNAGTAQ
jgi:uncharacterized lipoprotein YehR (DUF1307 family)